MTQGADGRDLPTGTVTFLRTDVEGSMALARDLGTRWDSVNATHLGLLREAVERHDGVCVRTEGDALFAAFPEASAALLAAIDGQRTLSEHAWPEDALIRVRMAVHTGEGHLAGDDYGGFDVNQAARIAVVGHGGQLIVSGTTAALVATRLPAGVRLRDLGRFVLKDVPAPEALYQVDIPGLRTEFPPLRVASPTQGNLPERVTSFVGRAADLDRLGRLLDENRLVTLTGPGGIGKTSIAIEVARGRADAVPDGAWFVALDSVTEPDRIGAEIARTLGLFDGAARPAADALPGFLAERATLLVLDNFEHLLGAAGAVAGLVRASPRSRFMVTSRAPLRIAGEQEYPVRPLGLSEAGASGSGSGSTTNDAFRLFADRARAVSPDWTPGSDEPIVAEICTLLDGLPLGIELAAARMSVLPASAIRELLVARLPLPGSGRRDAPDRQRTLEGAIAWSYDLLAPRERNVLQALAVFEGGFDAEQVRQAIVGSSEAPDGRDVLDTLVALTEQSLISRDTGGGGATATAAIRFRMLTIVQSFALKRLIDSGEEPAARSRHSLAYLMLAEEAARHLWAAGQGEWLDRLAFDQANLRTALRWSIEAGNADTALRLVAALWRFWQLDGHVAEGHAWVEAVLATPGAEDATPARVHALAAAGGIAYWRGERLEALDLYRSQLTLAEQLGDVAATADAYFNLAAANFVTGDTSESYRCESEAHRLYLEIGDQVGANRASWGAANLAYTRDGPEAGLAAMMAVHQQTIELGDAVYEALASASIAWNYDAMGDNASAAAWAIRSMARMYRLRDLGSTTIGLPIAALVAIGADRPEDGAVIVGAFEALCERYGVKPPLGLADLIQRSDPLGRIAENLEPEVMAAALERGRRSSLGDVIALIEQIGRDAGWSRPTPR